MMVFKVRHLKKSYKDRIVLDIDSLDLEGSRIYSLTGPNGAGKSTLLSILAFLAKPDSGTVEFSGQQVNYKKNRLLALRRRVVLVDQYPLLFTSPVWKNVEFGLRLRGVEKKDRQRLVREPLVMVGI
ncbi:MAG: ATP-binding cassette domain-containing protein, partial [Thermodesulfobacteriota bacterium]